MQSLRKTRAKAARIRKGAHTFESVESVKDLFLVDENIVETSDRCRSETPQRPTVVHELTKCEGAATSSAGFRAMLAIIQHSRAIAHPILGQESVLYGIEDRLRYKGDLRRQ